MLGGEAVRIAKLPPLPREPLSATAPSQRLKREPIIRCFGHEPFLNQAAHVPGSGASADRKRTASPIGEPGQGPRGDDRRRRLRFKKPTVLYLLALEEFKSCG
jgi:hypothetical protein